MYESHSRGFENALKRVLRCAQRPQHACHADSRAVAISACAACRSVWSGEWDGRGEDNLEAILRSSGIDIKAANLLKALCKAQVLAAKVRALLRTCVREGLQRGACLLFESGGQNRPSECLSVLTAAPGACG